MSKPNLCLHAVVVGPDEQFVVDAGEVLTRRQIDYVQCENVYSAIAAMTINGESTLLLIGQLPQLSREQGRFFDIVRRRQCLCCAVVDGDSLQSPALTAMSRQGGDLRICDRANLDRTVAALIADSRTRAGLGRRVEPHKTGQSGEIRASRAEMEALLGLWVDESNGRKSR